MNNHYDFDTSAFDDDLSYMVSLDGDEGDSELKALLMKVMNENNTNKRALSEQEKPSFQEKLKDPSADEEEGQNRLENPHLRSSYHDEVTTQIGIRHPRTSLNRGTLIADETFYDKEGQEKIGKRGLEEEELLQNNKDKSSRHIHQRKSSKYTETFLDDEDPYENDEIKEEK